MTKELGYIGESIVLDYVSKLGYTLVCKNFSCKYGEIDLICLDGKTLCFIEVKTRSRSTFLSHELINYSKKNKIIKTAKFFLSKNSAFLNGFVFRFDIALVEEGLNKAGHVCYYQDAFKVEG